MKYITVVNDHEYIIEIDNEQRIKVNDQLFDVDFQQLSEGGILSLLLDNHSVEAIVEERDSAWEVLLHGELYSVVVQDERAYRLAKARGMAADVSGDAVIKAPMPGVIVAVAVTEGQHVHKGDKIVILESMKMENELRSPRDGTVLRIQVEAGVTVEKDQVLAVVGERSGDGPGDRPGDES
jgi:biotin carboxyl carrier protein